MTRSAAAGIAIALASSTPSIGQSILGYGIMPCAEVISVIQREPWKSAIASWMGGYLSGVNALLVVRDGKFIDLSSLTSLDIMTGHLIARCSSNPNQQMAEAANQIALSLPLRPFQKRQ